MSTSSELQDAIDSQVSNITLSDNITMDTASIDYLGNLDLGGYTLTGDVSYNTTESGSLTIENGTIDGDLTVEAENASVTNDATVTGTVTINDVSDNTWDENADDNTLIIDDSDATLNINGSTEDVTVTNASTINVDTNANVGTLTANNAVTVNGAGNIEQANVEADGVEMDESPQATGGSHAPEVEGKGTVVHDQETLDNALAGNSDIITLNNDIDYTNGPSSQDLGDRLSIESGVTLDGDGHTLTVTPNSGSKGVPAVTIANTNDENVEIRNLNLERNSADDSTFYQGIAVYADNVTMSNLTISNNVSAGSEDGAGVWIGTGDYNPHSDNINTPNVAVDTIDIDDNTLNNISAFANDAVSYDGTNFYEYSSGDVVFFTEVDNSTAADDNLNLDTTANPSASSNNEDVATAAINDSNQVEITSVGAGSTTINVTDENSGEATIDVTVASNGSITVENVNPNFIESVTTQAYSELGLGTFASTSSGDPSIVTAAENTDGDIEVTSVSEGTATVTVTDDTDATATFDATVAADGSITIDNVSPN